MSKAQRDAAKDHGGFVAGVLMGGRRKIDTVEVRSMLALDGDRIDAAFLAGYESLCPYASVLYTTHSSTPDNPRVRLVFPLTRDVTPEEFVAVSRYVAQMLGIDYFDECSYQPNQLMYWPSSPQNGVFVYKETNGECFGTAGMVSQCKKRACFFPLPLALYLLNRRQLGIILCSLDISATQKASVGSSPHWPFGQAGGPFAEWRPSVFNWRETTPDSRAARPVAERR